MTAAVEYTAVFFTVGKSVAEGDKWGSANASIVIYLSVSLVTPPERLMPWCKGVDCQSPIISKTSAK